MHGILGYTHGLVIDPITEYQVFFDLSQMYPKSGTLMFKLVNDVAYLPSSD